MHSARKGTYWYFYAVTVAVLLIPINILEIILTVASVWFKDIQVPLFLLEDSLALDSNIQSNTYYLSNLNQ